MSAACQHCGTLLEQEPTGRPKKWCSERCRKAAGPRTARRAGDGEPVAPAVDALLDALQFADDDPRVVVGLLLRLVAEGLDADPGYPVAMIRELRMLLTFIASGGVGAVGEVDERRVHFLKDRLLSRVGES